MDLTPEPVPDNVIAIRPEIKIQFTPERAKWCKQQCRQVVVVEETRNLKCQHCGRIIDAFDYVLAIARRDINLVNSEKELGREIREKQQQLDRLKQLVQNAKGQARRAGVPEKEIRITNYPTAP